MLLVLQDGRPLVLDNRRAPLEEYRDYRPLLALTAASRWRLENPQRTFAQVQPAAE